MVGGGCEIAGWREQMGRLKKRGKKETQRERVGMECLIIMGETRRRTIRKKVSLQ